MDDQRALKLLRIPALLIGVLFILVGIFRPSVLWDLGKVESGRKVLGEGGMSAVFIVFGLIFCVAIVATALKRAPK